MVIRGSTLAAYVILGALTCAFLVDEQNWKRAPVTRNKITIVFFISLYILLGKIINLQPGLKIQCSASKEISAHLFYCQETFVSFTAHPFIPVNNVLLSGA
jgi:hypothetical protein